jgi:hypothetical protein
VNGIQVTGLVEVVQKLEQIQGLIDRKTVLDDAAEIFAARLRAATPKGYSGRLRDSVIYEVTDGEALIGYEQDVETAGNPKLDSVLRPKTRGRSVLKWVSADELGTVLEETFDAYAPEGVVYIEERLAEQIDGIT